MPWVSEFYAVSPGGRGSLSDPPEGEILGLLQGEEVRRMTGNPQEPDRDRAVGEPEPAIRRGGDDACFCRARHLRGQRAPARVLRMRPPQNPP